MVRKNSEPIVIKKKFLKNLETQLTVTPEKKFLIFEGNGPLHKALPEWGPYVSQMAKRYDRREVIVIGARNLDTLEHAQAAMRVERLRFVWVPFNKLPYSALHTGKGQTMFVHSMIQRIEDAEFLELAVPAMKARRESFLKIGDKIRTENAVINACSAFREVTSIHHVRIGDSWGHKLTKREPLKVRIVDENRLICAINERDEEGVLIDGDGGMVEFDIVGIDGDKLSAALLRERAFGVLNVQLESETDWSELHLGSPVKVLPHPAVTEDRQEYIPIFSRIEKQ